MIQLPFSFDLYVIGMCLSYLSVLTFVFEYSAVIYCTELDFSLCSALKMLDWNVYLPQQIGLRWVHDQHLPFLLLIYVFCFIWGGFYEEKITWFVNTVVYWNNLSFYLFGSPSTPKKQLFKISSFIFVNWEKINPNDLFSLYVLVHFNIYCM